MHASIYRYVLMERQNLCLSSRLTAGTFLRAGPSRQVWAVLDVLTLHLMHCMHANSSSTAPRIVCTALCRHSTSRPRVASRLGGVRRCVQRKYAAAVWDTEQGTCPLLTELECTDCAWQESLAMLAEEPLLHSTMCVYCIACMHPAFDCVHRQNVHAHGDVDSVVSFGSATSAGTFAHVSRGVGWGEERPVILLETIHRSATSLRMSCIILLTCEQLRHAPCCGKRL